MAFARSRFSFQKFAAATLSLLLLAAVDGAIRGPGKYSGVVVFDRWDSCYLYSGVYLMEVSEKAKETLRPYRDQAITLDAKEVFQPMNPGDGLITKLEVLGPAPEAVTGSFGAPPILDGLSLNMTPSFSNSSADELIIELRNDGNTRRAIDTRSLGPTLFSKKRLPCFLDPSDGPSYAALTRSSINLLTSSFVGPTCSVNGETQTAKVALPPGIAISQRVNLDPGDRIEIPLRLEVSPGEYEALAGYGGGVHAFRPLVSNPFSFDVDSQGRAHLLAGSTNTNRCCSSSR